MFMSLKDIYLSEGKRTPMQENLAKRLRDSQEKAEKIGRGKRWREVYEKYREDYNDVLTSIQRADGVVGIRVASAINEKAVSPKEAKKQKLALRVIHGANGPDDTEFILYDAQKVLTMANEKAEDDGPLDYDTLWWALRESIMGMVVVGSPGSDVTGYVTGGANGARPVQGSAAVHGYGPLMYDIAMSQFKNGLMPDRRSVTGSAKKVWKYYSDSRADVKKLPLDNIVDPKTPTPKDDAKYLSPTTLKNPLNWSYSLGKNIPITTLLQNDKKLFAQLKNIGLAKKRFRRDKNHLDVAEIFSSAADSFFHSKYR
jgi:hypothetical protein